MADHIRDIVRQKTDSLRATANQETPHQRRMRLERERDAALKAAHAAKVAEYAAAKGIEVTA